MFYLSSLSQSQVHSVGQIVTFCECTILGELDWQLFSSGCTLLESWEVLWGLVVKSNLGIVPTQLWFVKDEVYQQVQSIAQIGPKLTFLHTIYISRP